MGRRTFLAVAVLVTLLVAGFASHYASDRPDGLERVAGQTGFLDSAEEPRFSGPLAGYRTEGVDDGRLSGGIAGVAGVALVGVLGGGLFWLLRRRTPEGDDAEHRPDGIGA